VTDSFLKVPVPVYTVPGRATTCRPMLCVYSQNNLLNEHSFFNINYSIDDVSTHQNDNSSYHNKHFIQNTRSTLTEMGYSDAKDCL